ncbi:Putative N-acetyltransferase 8B [Myotis brandtii]|uniref:Putative N-acetyltransferase 8B n=1 Tax=Myotis brandtii TaxID=109478 RepID=S7PDX1_MYOBR|nr:PREDICTED: putative N-acetyltransferase 8B [Myotis brandtii]XP_005867805.1 PREDICTED: putative N-acetyltransferase 8B [Myotis brandtii]XP_014396413.1 PREDICTED: putative N-acetyltransferase 8B [Myotis brandtii]EPQ08693.1 Putative N-acetyltransferase 8B [Myotis brandtii]
MAPYHIRKYQESDRPRVLDLFARGMAEHAPTTFRHILKLPRTLVLLLGGALALFVVSGSWLLALMAGLTLLAALRFLAKYPWTEYVSNCLRTDMRDISKSYLSEPGSCFWVAECEGQVVGTVGALPVGEPTLRKEQVELFHLSVAWEHRGQGIAKALVRTVLQFARDQGYREVVLSTSMLQYSALALYQRLGFRKTGQDFPSMMNRLFAIPIIHLTYQLPSAHGSQAPGQRQGL